MYNIRGGSLHQNPQLRLYHFSAFFINDDAFCTDGDIIADINDCMGQMPALDGMGIQQSIFADNGVGSDNR